MGAIVEESKEFNPYARCPCLPVADIDAAVKKNAPSVPSICLVENDYSLKLNVANFKMMKYSESQSVDQFKGCDVLVNITASSVMRHKYECPESCEPFAYVEIENDWVTLNPSLNANATLTCSMKMSELASTIVGHHKGHDTGNGHSLPGSIPADVIIHEIAKRRMQECHEHHTWMQMNVHHDHSAKHDPSLTPAATNINTIAAHDEHLHHGHHNKHKHYHVVKRKVYGLIIWVGSTSRPWLMLQQIQSLKGQPSSDEEAIVGWMASEDQYPCRVGTTACFDQLIKGQYYHAGMPKTKMDLSPSGWSCAQRRQLRALSHTLILFDPEFVLLVDDDTYVSVELLNYGTPLSHYILEEMKEKPIVHGEMQGDRISKRGFFWGGAGYLIGRNVIERLTSYELNGPPEIDDSIRDLWRNLDLSFIREVYPLSQYFCPIVNPDGTSTGVTSTSEGKPLGGSDTPAGQASITVAQHQKSTCLEVNYNATGGEMMTEQLLSESGLKVKASLSIRLVELCANLLSGEHTCYHSDHAVTRCMVHAAYADVTHIYCGGSTLRPGLLIGMCMGCEGCDHLHHITCHRWVASANDSRIPSALSLEITARRLDLNFTYTNSSYVAYREAKSRLLV